MCSITLHVHCNLKSSVGLGSIRTRGVREIKEGEKKETRLETGAKANKKKQAVVREGWESFSPSLSLHPSPFVVLHSVDKNRSLFLSHFLSRIIALFVSSVILNPHPDIMSNTT
jgi:hypothetical protein